MKVEIGIQVEKYRLHDHHTKVNQRKKIKYEMKNSNNVFSFYKTYNMKYYLGIISMTHGKRMLRLGFATMTLK